MALTDPALTQAAYRRHLVRLHGFHAGLEATLAAACPWSHWGLDFEQRRKLPALQQDLQVLGIEPPARAPQHALPPLPSAAAAFGCAYVLEGATLGGQIIGRHLQQRLGITPASGGLFFSGYGARTGAMWRGFCDALEAFGHGRGAEHEVVDAARATFGCLAAWCSRAHAQQQREEEQAP